MTVLEKIRADISERLNKRSEHQEKIDEILSAVEGRDDQSLTDDEQNAFDEARDAIRAIDDENASDEARVAELEELAERSRKADEARQRFPGDDKPTVRVGAEEPVYRPDRGSFFGDMYRSQYMTDSAASDRLRRHGEQMAESRAVGTGAFGEPGGLIPPQYLLDEFADLLRNGRAFANAVRGLPLPDTGLTFNIPRAQTGTSTASQTTENTAVSNTDLDFDDDLTVSVRTIAGQQDVSRQSLERGTPGIDQLVFADLVADYAETLDLQLLDGSGAAGQHLGVTNLTTGDGIDTVSFTDTTPTVAEAWPKVTDAIQAVGGARKLPANLIVMHGRRWGWFISALDGQNRPLIVADPSAAVNAMGVQAAQAFGEGQLVGTLQGLPVLVDNNIPTTDGSATNEDKIIVLRRQDPILWEEGDGMPRQLRFDEPGSGALTVKLVAYGYSAFTALRRPQAISVISGAGLKAPSF